MTIKNQTTRELLRLAKGNEARLEGGLEKCKTGNAVTTLSKVRHQPCPRWETPFPPVSTAIGTTGQNCKSDGFMRPTTDARGRSSALTSSRFSGFALVCAHQRSCVLLHRL